MSGNSSGATRLRVLVVEDELLIGDLLDGMITDLGHEVVAVVPRVAEALAAIARETFDFAIVDVRLHGEVSLPVADALMAKGVLFIFVTGLGESGLPESYRKLPLLRKPFTKADLAQQLDGLARPGGAQGAA
ncbi:MAG: response regulator [Xanthobacteraceae bacterium]|nr:response regulator [Xanthobacteraceae bacterium]